MIECVPEEFNQVLSNLVQNAIEACPETGGMVRIRGRQEGEELMLSVKDNGPGVRTEDVQRIFTPFFTTKGPGRGMGMGLTITWLVIQSLGGTVEVKPGLGAESCCGSRGSKRGCGPCPKTAGARCTRFLGPTANTQLRVPGFQGSAADTR